MSLWSPTFCLGHGRNKPNKLIAKALMAYNGSLPPILIERPLQVFLKSICSIIGSNLRDYFVRKRFGMTGGQLIIDPDYIEAFIISLSSRELAQRSQSAMSGFMHHYDFMDPRMNSIVYGEVATPRYDLSHIKLRSITIWLGNADSVVSELDILSMLGHFSGKGKNRTAPDLMQ